MLDFQITGADWWLRMWVQLERDEALRLVNSKKYWSVKMASSFDENVVDESWVGELSQNLTPFLSTTNVPDHFHENSERSRCSHPHQFRSDAGCSETRWGKSGENEIGSVSHFGFTLTEDKVCNGTLSHDDCVQSTKVSPRPRPTHQHTFYWWNRWIFLWY